MSEKSGLLPCENLRRLICVEVQQENADPDLVTDVQSHVTDAEEGRFSVLI